MHGKMKKKKKQVILRTVNIVHLQMYGSCGRMIGDAIRKEGPDLV